MAIAERELTAPAQLTEANFEPQPYLWTREQFYEAGEIGLFAGQKVMLIEGEILAMPPIKPPHQGLTTIVGEVMRAAFGNGFVVREQAPYNIGTVTDPQPDIAVVKGSMRDFLLSHPTQAALIIEVSDTTLAYDRREKASLYARAGVTDYWIVNVKEAQVEVHRQPGPDETQAYGFGYREKTIYRSGGIIHPLNGPKPVAIAALLP